MIGGTAGYSGMCSNNVRGGRRPIPGATHRIDDQGSSTSKPWGDFKKKHDVISKFKDLILIRLFLFFFFITSRFSKN